MREVELGKLWESLKKPKQPARKQFQEESAGDDQSLEDFVSKLSH
jgi:hypothetical protein